METCPSIRAHWRHLASPQSKRKWIGLAVFAQLRQKVPILYNGRPYPPELPLSMGDLDLPCNTWCLQPMRDHNPNGTSIGSAVFAQMTTVCLYSLQWFADSPSKLPLPMLASGPHVIHGSLGPPESGTQMVICSFHPFFAGLTSVTHWQSDRKTDRQTGAMRRNYA